QTYIRREYGIAVGERTAEEIKMAIGSACPLEEELKAEVRGRDLMSGLPKTVILSPTEIRQATEAPTGAIADSVLSCLAQPRPASVGSGRVEGAVDGRHAKGGHRDDGATADGGPIVLGGQDGGKSLCVAAGPEGGDRGLATRGVGVVARDLGARVDCRAVTPF